MLSEELNEFLVDFARENHFYNFNSSVVRVAQTVYETALDAESLEHIIYLRAAAVNENDLYSDKRKKNDIIHNSVLQLVIGHCVSAVFDNEYLVVVLLYVRKRVDKYLRLIVI